jgi:DNA-binding XRE family transcriptional regulator
MHTSGTVTKEYYCRKFQRVMSIDHNKDLRTRSVLENIHNLRRLREYSQDFMAYKLGISQNAYSKLESGKSPLTIDRFFRIAELLNISPLQLLEERIQLNLTAL